MPLEKLLTLPLKRFLNYYLSTLDKRQIELEDAKAIVKLDPDEIFCHVQFTDLDSGKPLEHPLLWNINDWHSDYEVFKSKKKKSAIDNIKWDIYKKNLEIVAARLMDITFIDKDAAIKTAELILKKNNPVAISNLGVKLAAFDESMIPKDLYGL